MKKSVEKFTTIYSSWNYGYKWWLTTYSVNGIENWSYSARGWGGQKIIVFPSLNMIVVFTGGNYTQYEPVDEIVQEYILPAVL